MPFATVYLFIGAKVIRLPARPRDFKPVRLIKLPAAEADMAARCRHPRAALPNSTVAMASGRVLKWAIPAVVSRTTVPDRDNATPVIGPRTDRS